MNRTYMQKGIGAAPFAIVAALIIALAAGFWVTQPAQAADGDLTVAFPPTVEAPAEVGAAIDATAAAAGIAFRGSTDRGSSVAVTVTVEDTSADAADTTYPLQIDVTGPASLSASNTLTTGACNAVGAGTCVFNVYTSGEAGEFSVRASAGTGDLTDATAGDPKSAKGQWVGPAVTVEVLKGAPANSGVDLDPGDSGTDSKIGDLFGVVSPSAFLGGFDAGLLADGDTGTDGNQPQTGFLFQLADSAGQAPLALSGDDRDAPRVQVITDSADEDVTLRLASATLSVPAADSSNLIDSAKTVYAAIGNEAALVTGTGYPVLDSVRDNTATPPTGKYYAGGLIGVALDDTTVARGKAALGRIVVTLSGGDTLEHPIAIAGDPDGDMSSVSAASSPLNLDRGQSHTRIVSLRDANGTPVPDSMSLIVWAETDAAAADLYHTVAAKSGSAGDYTLTIWANQAQTDDIAASADGVTPVVEAEVKGGIPDDVSRDAALGRHAFTVRINKLDGATEVVKKTTDADGGPLEAHVASGIQTLSVTSVTNDAGDELLDAGTASAPEFTWINIVLAAGGEAGDLPITGSTVTSSAAASGFAGAASGGGSGTTNDAGEVTLRYGTGDTSRTLFFSGGTGSAQLIVRVSSADAPADTGPRVYSLASQAGGDFHNWTGGVASSSEFENVANLVAVWKWTGGMWVGYVSAPNAPAATKTNYSLQDGDTLFVVANGPVDLTLD